MRTLAGDGLGALVQRHLTADAQLLELVPDYVRWKDHDGSLLGFRATVLEDGAAGPSSTYVTARTAPPRRLADEAARLHHRAEEDHGGLRAFAFVPDEELLLIGFPMDRAMHDLRRLVRASKVRSLLANTCPKLIPAGQRFSKSRSNCRLVRYKPERRAVLRWDVGCVDDFGGAAARQTVWVRSHAEPQAARTCRATNAAAANGVRVPLTLGIAHERVAIEAHVAGELWQPFAANTEPQGTEFAATALARLHDALQPHDLPSHGPLAELDLALRAAEDLARLDPDLGLRAQHLADVLARHVPAGGQFVLAHGDLHPDQILLDGEIAGLVDFDRACLAPAAHDLATLNAHCVALAADRGAQLTAAFAMAYANHRALPDATERAWWNASALLRTATGPFRRLDRAWPAHTNQLLAAAEAALRQHSAAAGR